MSVQLFLILTRRLDELHPAFISHKFQHRTGLGYHSNNSHHDPVITTEARKPRVRDTGSWVVQRNCLLYL